HHLRVEHGQGGTKQVAATGRAVVEQQNPAHADSCCPEFRYALGPPLANTRDAVAAADVQVHVAVAAEDADRQRSHISAVDHQPVELDFLELFVGRVFV